MRPGPNPSSPGKHRGSPTLTLNRTVSRSWSAWGGAGRSRMSSRVIESIGTGCDGRVSSRRRLGWVGSWANADATRAATMISVAILVTVFVAFKKCSSFPDVEVYSGGPAPSSIPLGPVLAAFVRAFGSQLRVESPQSLSTDHDA